MKNKFKRCFKTAVDGFQIEEFRGWGTDLRNLSRKPFWWIGPVMLCGWALMIIITVWSSL
jgi:hypothetical protein